MPVPTPNELADILAIMLAGAAGGTKAKWRKIIGTVEKLPTWANVRSNWRVYPKASPADLATIGKAVEIARAAHPYVAA
ncbi:MAG: hypothetical protein JWR80_769 [Bradyrhizobium sp.]|nr:hypothetical protein [Bradyrhizobium sp.]